MRMARLDVDDDVFAARELQVPRSDGDEALVVGDGEEGHHERAAAVVLDLDACGPKTTHRADNEGAASCLTGRLGCSKGGLVFHPGKRPQSISEAFACAHRSGRRAPSRHGGPCCTPRAPSTVAEVPWAMAETSLGSRKLPRVGFPATVRAKVSRLLTMMAPDLAHPAKQARAGRNT